MAVGEAELDDVSEIVLYAAGEIHSEWRDELRGYLEAVSVQAEVIGPQEQHDRSDSVGEDILGVQPNARYRDLIGARVNTLRTRVLMQRADLCVAFLLRDRGLLDHLSGIIAGALPDRTPIRQRSLD